MPLFVDAKKGIWYIGPSAGMMISGKQNFGGYFNDTIIDPIFQSRILLKYSPYITAVVGYRPFDYNFRFEFEFGYMNYLSSSIVYPTYETIYGHYVQSMAASMQRFLLGFNLYYNIDTPFTIASKKIGFFFGIGGGISINKAYLHMLNYYKSTTGALPDPTTDSIITNNENSLSPSTSSSNIINVGGLMIAGYFSFSAGFTVDITDIILIQVKTKYMITTKPFANMNLSSVGQKLYGSGIMQNQLVGLEMAILFRTN